MGGIDKAPKRSDVKACVEHAGSVITSVDVFSFRRQPACPVVLNKLDRHIGALFHSGLVLAFVCSWDIGRPMVSLNRAWPLKNPPWNVRLLPENNLRVSGLKSNRCFDEG